MKILLILIFSVAAAGFEPISDSEMSRRILLLDHRPVDVDVELELERVSKSCQIFSGYLEVFDPVDHRSDKLKFLYYLPKTDRQVPGVVITPNIDGVTPLEKRAASKLCQRSISSVFYESAELARLPAELPGWEVYDQNTRRNVVRARSLIDFLESREEIIRSRIGVFGASLGAVMSAIVSAVDTRVKLSVLAAGALNVPGVLAHTTQSTISKLRQDQTPFLDDGETFESRLRREIKLDASFFARFINPEQVYMMITEKDKTVPTRYQWQLWDYFGRPALETFPYNHVMGLVRYVLGNFGNTLDFAEEKLKFERIPIHPGNDF